MNDHQPATPRTRRIAGIVLGASVVVLACQDQTADWSITTNPTSGGGDSWPVFTTGRGTADGGGTGSTGMSADATSGTSTTSDWDPTGGFIDMPDGGGLDGGYCDIVNQDCPSGHKCTAWGCQGLPLYECHRCVPIAEDPQPVGEPCTMEDFPWSGLDDCDIGAVCWGVDPDTLEGTCIGLCKDGRGFDLDCPDSQMLCVILSDTLPVCLTPCHPLTADCPRGQRCRLVTEGAFSSGGSALVCLPDVGAGADPVSICDGGRGCPPEHACVDADILSTCSAGEHCCTPFCDLDSPDPCAPDLACQPVFNGEATPPDADNVGVCGDAI